MKENLDFVEYNVAAWYFNNFIHTSHVEILNGLSARKAASQGWYEAGMNVTFLNPVFALFTSENSLQGEHTNPVPGTIYIFIHI